MYVISNTNQFGLKKGLRYWVTRKTIQLYLVRMSSTVNCYIARHWFTSENSMAKITVTTNKRAIVFTSNEEYTRYYAKECRELDMCFEDYEDCMFQFDNANIPPMTKEEYETI
jgi:hypothetical protein